MKMNKISLMAALAAGAMIALGSVAQAGDKPDRPEGGPRAGEHREKAKERLAKLAEALDLTEEQRTKVAAAMKEQAETLRGLKDATPEERKEKMQAAKAELEAAMKEILTAEQYAKWEKFREQHRPGGHGRPGKPPRGEKPE
jgi:Spy/CpxP family protein refolding chaperone